MKLMNMTITAIIFFALPLAAAEAGTRQVGGLILGGGTGAIVGQAIGHNTESTIVGAAVGGAVGMVIGTELDRQDRSLKQPSKVIVYASAHNHQRGPKVRRHSTHQPRFKQQKHFHQPNHNYRNKHSYTKTVVTKKGHHKTRRTVSISRGTKHHDRYHSYKNARHNVRMHH